MKKIIVLLILATLILSPVFCFAQTSAQDQANQQLILTLTQLLVKLQNQLNDILAKNPGIVAAPNSAPALTPYLIPVPTTAVTPAPTANTSAAHSTVTPTTGTTSIALSLERASTYSSQTVIAPQTNFKLSDFSLTNNSKEAVKIKTIQVDMAIGADLYTANMYVTNLYVIYDGIKTEVLSTVAHSNYFQIDFSLPAGKKIDLSLYGSVNSYIPVNSSVNSSILVSGVSTVISGQSITFGTGSLTVSKDSSTSSTKMFVANQKIVAEKLQFTSKADSYTISQLKFVIPNSGNIPVITDVVLADNVTQITLATTVITGDYIANYSTFNFDVNIPVLLNSTKSLTIYYDLSSGNNYAVANTNIAPVLVYVKASDSSGKIIDGSAVNYNITSASFGGIVLPSAGIAGDSVYTFKSLPTFTAGLHPVVSVSNDSDADLYTLNIKADVNGDISIKQLTFQIAINDSEKSNPYLNSFKFLKGNSDYTGSVAIGNILNDHYSELLSNGGIGIGMTNNVVVTFDREEIIPAGKTQTYTLKAHANKFINTTGSGVVSVSTSVPSDVALSKINNYLASVYSSACYGLKNIRSEENPIWYSLIWSDRSSSSHNDSSNYSSNDWYNGFGILNLPLSAQTISAR